jgi:hypothetical protein
MARTKYAETFGKTNRNDKTLERAEYLSRTREFALRGQDLPQSKLLDIDVHGIKSAVRQRENLRKHIADNLSNASLAKTYNVHIRTIEKIVQCHTWSHVL